MAKRITDFKAFDDKKSQNYLASHTPKGRLFGKRFSDSSNIYKLIMALATFIKLVTGQIETLARNRDISQASELLPEWETSVGIPSKYPRRSTTSGMREAIERKVSKIPVYNVQTSGSAPIDTTIEEYVRKITGISITITFDEPQAGFPIAFPIVFDLTGGTDAFYFRIHVPVEGSSLNNQFPIPFPVSFFEPQIPIATQELLDIVLNDVIPSNADWVYEAEVV